MTETTNATSPETPGSVVRVMDDDLSRLVQSRSADLFPALSTVAAQAGAALAQYAQTPAHLAAFGAATASMEAAHARAIGGISLDLTAAQAAIGRITRGLDRASETARQLAATSGALDAARALPESTESREIAALRKRTRSLARGHSAVVVAVTRLVADELAQGHTLTAVSILHALDGDADALQAWAELSAEGLPLARVVCSLLRLLESLRISAAEVLVGTVEVVSRLSLASLDTLVPHAPRVTLAGSVDRCAP